MPWSNGTSTCPASNSGQVIWQRDLNKDYEISMPIWGISASPLVYDELIFVHIGAADGASVVALDRNTGKEVGEH